MDDFGHPIKLTYKGEESHQTTWGGLLTVSMRIMMLFVVYKFVKEMILMEEPTITSVSVPIPEDSRSAVNFADYGYFFGFSIEVYGGKTSAIPSNVGSFIAEVLDLSTFQSKKLEMKDCLEVIRESDSSFETKNNNIASKLNKGSI